MFASKARGRFYPWQAGSESGHVWSKVGLINLQRKTNRKHEDEIFKGDKLQNRMYVNVVT